MTGEGRFSGKVAIVTGGGSGIGRQAARTIAAEGGVVVVADLSLAAAEETVKTIEEEDRGQATAVEVDIAVLASTEAMVATTVDRHGRVDILVNSAGISEYGKAADLDPEIWARVIGINLTGTWHCARAVLPGMVKERSGALVNVASIAGLVGNPLGACYAASKAGVIGLTRQMAIDYGPEGIRINAVCPGTVPTALSRRGFALKGGGSDAEIDQKLAQRAGIYPLRRIGRVEDVANLIAFLASDDAGWITGAIYPVDGGLTASSGLGAT